MTDPDSGRGGQPCRESDVQPDAYALVDRWSGGPAGESGGWHFPLTGARTGWGDEPLVDAIKEFQRVGVSSDEKGPVPFRRHGPR